MVHRTLDEVLERVIDHRGRTPKKLGGDFVPSGVPVISAMNIAEDGFSLESVRFISTEMFDRWMPEKLRLGDVLLTSEAPLGRAAFLNDSAGYCLGQRLFALRADRRVLEPRFLYYALRSPTMQQRLRARATGTTAQGIRQSELLKVVVDLPVLSVQRAIAAVLGALDDKIDLNRRMNQTLERLAAALFRAWFVDFEPVRARAEGRAPVGIDAETAALFPNRIVRSEGREIPDGWALSTVGDEFAVTMGQSPPGSTYNYKGEGLPFYQGRADFGSRFPSRRVYCTAPSRLANKGDALLSVRAPVGSLNVAWENCAVGRGVAALRHSSGSSAFGYYLLRALSPMFEPFNGEGTVFGSISRADLQRLPVMRPPEAVVAAFDGVALPLDDRIRVNEEQNRTLAALRDLLLPRLLSGELRVPAAEAAIEEAL